MLSAADIYIFGTCRVSYPLHKNIKFVKKIREYHSNHYKINSNIDIYTQPVNYTTNLTDILDSIYYMKGKLYNNLNPMNHEMLQSIFFRGHKQPQTNFIKPNTHPSLDSTKKINFSKIIIEVFSIKKNIINTSKYGEEFYLKNLPWKINTDYQHNDIIFNENDFIIQKLTKDECFNILNEIKKEVKCDIMIIGPYISKKVPDFVNEIRTNTQNILKDFCLLNNWTYFDLSEAIQYYNNIEIDATHFNEKGKEILSDEIYKFII